MSPQLSARVEEDLNDEVEAFSDEIDGTKTEAIRILLERGLQYDEITTENKRLDAQLKAANHRIDASNELVSYVEEERSIQERERELRQANIVKRAWWWIAGEPDE